MEILDRNIFETRCQGEVEYSYKILVDMHEPADRVKLYKLLDWDLRKSGLLFSRRLLESTKTEMGMPGLMLYVKGIARIESPSAYHGKLWMTRSNGHDEGLRYAGDYYPPSRDFLSDKIEAWLPHFEKRVNEAIVKKKEIEEGELLLLIEGN